MSACNAHAMSQVGCRLMVASSAKTSRPLLPDAKGAIAFALATKAAISSDVDGSRSGSELPSRSRVTSRLGFELLGSPDIACSRKPQCGLRSSAVNAPPPATDEFGTAGVNQLRATGAEGATGPASVMPG